MGAAGKPSQQSFCCIAKLYPIEFNKEMLIMLKLWQIPLWKSLWRRWYVRYWRYSVGSDKSVNEYPKTLGDEKSYIGLCDVYCYL